MIGIHVITEVAVNGSAFKEQDGWDYVCDVCKLSCQCLVGNLGSVC